MINVRVKTSGPLFSPQRKAHVFAAMTKSMKGAVLLGERTIKRGYVRSPAPNVVGGRKTSHLSRGVRGKVYSALKAIIAPGRFAYGRDVPYAPFVEFGRAASNQTIRPRRAKALRFKPRGSSAYIYRRSAKPFRRALKGNPMFKKTANDRSYLKAIRRLFGKQIRAALT